MKCNETVAEIQQNFSTKNGFLASRLESFHQDMEDNFAQSIAAKMVPRTLSPVQTYKSDSNGNSINAIATTNGNSVDAIDTNGDAFDDNGSTVSGGEEKENFKDGEVTVLSSQVCKLQETLSSLQQESEQQINNLRQELADKTSIVESLQHQIRMKMILNLAGAKPNQVFQAFQDMQGNQDSSNEDAVTSWRKNLELLAGSQDKFKSPPQPGSPASSPAPMDAPEQAPSTPEGDRFSPQRNIESMSPGKERLHLTPSPLQINPQHQGGFSLGGGLLPPHSVATSSPLTHQPLIVPKSFANTGANLWRSRIPKEDPLEERLHEMLRYNMEKFADAPIDTIGDSRRVRELLSVHNIGQRLFAKYVLGLSQGTVSELLSKPKSWDKLTEKGRDSYRKMHAWVWDDQAILLLKTLIPRKGELLKQSASASRLEHEERNEERLNKILSEVNKSPDSHHKHMLEHQALNPGLLLPGFPGQMPQGPGSDDIKQALSFYQAELNRQQQHQQQMLNKSDQLQEDKIWDASKEEKENQQDKKPSTPNLDDLKSQLPFSSLFQQHSPGAGGPIRPPPQLPPHTSVAGHMPPTSPAIFHPSGFAAAAAAAAAGIDSPLQRMASITNSLISQPLPAPGFGQRPLKAILPPITQHQFDLFSHLNTENVVRQIKEILSQYSISQRLFGEAVLGLSQGSVSDLLARPKPWHMLTQKGREPFIRMKLFLDDETAIHKLVASQYKILPDKLLRTGSFVGGPIGMPSVLPGGPGANQFRGLADLFPQFLNTSGGRLPPGLLPGMDRQLLNSLQQAGGLQSPGRGLPEGLPLLTPDSGLPHLTPNLYEMAALTQELDTVALTNKIKEVLLSNNLGQKLFGEAVLGFSQGSVSELLTKPKPWHSLSIKGREPFIRMQMWLSDATSIEKLNALRKLQEESRKHRKRPHGGDDIMSYSGKSTPPSESSISDVYSNPGGFCNDDDNTETGIKKLKESSGLDLSFKRTHGEIDVESDQDETDETSNGGGNGGNISGGNKSAESGRSRRKPLAPQWLNPTWEEEEKKRMSSSQDDEVGSADEDKSRDQDGESAAASRTINGVCVVNDYSMFGKEDKSD